MSLHPLQKKRSNSLGHFGVLKRARIRKLFPGLVLRHKTSDIHLLASKKTLTEADELQRRKKVDAPVSVEIHEVTGPKGRVGKVRAVHRFSVQLSDFRRVNENYRLFERHY